MFPLTPHWKNHGVQGFSPCLIPKGFVDVSAPFPSQQQQEFPGSAKMGETRLSSPAGEDGLLPELAMAAIVRTGVVQPPATEVDNDPK